MNPDFLFSFIVAYFGLVEMDLMVLGMLYVVILGRVCLALPIS